jgi:outer membrane receptor protein involved in Fe transport
VYKANIHKPSLRTSLLLGAASVAALGLALPASAQDQSVETVVVTGSRIPQTGLYSTSPVTAVSSQEVALSGTSNVENLLNNLPGVFADFGSTDSNGSTGTATVNLRGLGSSRTLVLVDGTRLMPGDPSAPVADLNNIPAALVDHVEVLTGGASAVYGSDALAGVVNFILRKDFQGIELDGQYSVNQASNGTRRFDDLAKAASFPSAPHNWWGGQNVDATLLMGTNTADGKGNITAYVSYRNTQPVLQSKRDFSACSLAFYQGYQTCAGSSNYNRWLSFDNIVKGPAGTPSDFFQEGTGAPGTGTFVPYTGSADQSFNYGPLNYLQRPDTRYTAGFFGHYQISPMADVYSSFMFADNHTLAQIAPSGSFLGSGPTNFPGTQSPGYLQVNCSNPLMTAQENQLLCGALPGDVFTADPRYAAGGYWDGAGNITANQALVWNAHRNIEGGNRVDDLRHTSYRAKIGMKGDLGDGWTYDVYGQYGLTLYTETYDNEWSKSRVQNALQVDYVGGVPTCSVAAQQIDPHCVPLDIFNGIGSVTPAMEDYVAAQGFKQGWTEEQILSGSVSGDLGSIGGQLPWAKSPIGVALGAEYRSESLELKTSRDFQINDLYGQGGATLPVPKSGFNVTEGFGEVRVPVVQGQPFMEDLTLNAGYRYSSYSSVGAVTSWKAGVEWQVIDDLKFRGSYNRATRAPNVLESFSPFNVALFGGQDPCASKNTGLCAGVPNADTSLLDCPASQCNAGYGGNMALKPEVSDTWSVGAVLTPTFLDGFTATVDYWNIKVQDYIGTIGAQTILNGCYNSGVAAQEAFYCPFVHRSAQGTVFGAGYVTNTTVNLPFLKTSGVDFEANYQTDLADWGVHDAGSLSANFVGTWLQHIETKSSQFENAYDCKGYYGLVCYTPNPTWRHKLRVTWSSPWDFDISVDWRHIGGVNLDANSTNPLIGGGAPLNPVGYACAAHLNGIQDCFDNRISAYDYFDLSGTWTVSPNVQLRAGIQNLFDKTPPAMDSTFYAVSSPPFGNGNTYPNVYDSLGRTMFVGATIKY